MPEQQLQPEIKEFLYRITDLSLWESFTVRTLCFNLYKDEWHNLRSYVEFHEEPIDKIERQLVTSIHENNGQVMIAEDVQPIAEIYNFLVGINNGLLKISNKMIYCKRLNYPSKTPNWPYGFSHTFIKGTTQQSYGGLTLKWPCHLLNGSGDNPDNLGYGWSTLSNLVEKLSIRDRQPLDLPAFLNYKVVNWSTSFDFYAPIKAKIQSVDSTPTDTKITISKSENVRSDRLIVPGFSVNPISGNEYSINYPKEKRGQECTAKLVVKNEIVDECKFVVPNHSYVMSAHQYFDNRGAVFDSYLKNIEKDSERFEKAIAWLFSFCGFNVMHLGHSDIKSEIDVLCFSNIRNVPIMLAVECTTFAPDQNGKLSVLGTRAQGLAASINCEVIPIMVTAIPKSQVQFADVETATKNGILILTAERLDEVYQLAKEGRRTEEIVAKLRDWGVNDRADNSRTEIRVTSWTR